MCKPKPKLRTWGFRFSLADAAAIGVFIVVAFFLRRMANPLWWMLIIVAGHFFLFCNVFRVRRSLELSWAGFFLINAAVCGWCGGLEWWRVLTIQLPVTLVAILTELRGGHYHGIYASRLNPNLKDYLKGEPL